MLRELGGSDYFTVASVEAFPHKQLWSDHVDDLARQGRISPDMRRLYKKNGEWTNSNRNVRPLIGANRILIRQPPRVRWLSSCSGTDDSR
jgi:hypothetical protein